MSANLRDYSDRGVILAIEDSLEVDGWANVENIGAALGQNNGLKGLGSRLAWMKRYKMVESHRHDKGRWRVSKHGLIGSRTPELEVIESTKGVQFDMIRRTVQREQMRRRR